MNVPRQRLGGDPFETDGAVPCPHCGSTVPATDEHCLRCGQPRLVVDASTVSQTRFGDDVADSPTQAPIERHTSADVTSHPDDGAPGTGRVDANDAADAMTMAPAAVVRSGATSGDTGPLEVGQSFGPRYHIIRLLGVGGMGAVYQAWDAELGVAVAIKVIRPQIMADAHAAAQVERRFKRELLLARQVTHRNVVRIHDLGMIDGVKYITMSYVDGTDLATRLKHEGKQPVSAVMRLARSVASGLVAAHSAGVVHRDLKPANVMIERGGEALIMDFGIALSTGDAAKSAPSHDLLPEQLRGAAAQFAVTTAAGIVGTVEYMAPEQAKGLAVDQRADIYAFGLILYDALLGRRRHQHAASAVEDLERRMVGSPTPVNVLVPDVPEALNGVIARCLEPDPAKRYQTSADLAADLSRLDDDGTVIPVARRLTPRLMGAAALVTIALLAGTFYLTRRAVQPDQVHGPVSVVIADLDNRTKDPAFDRTLEPMLRRALQDASFISAYDRSAISSLLGVQAPARFDETAARELAANQGLGVVLAGFIEPVGSGYRLGIKALHTVTGEALADEQARASSRDQMMQVATRLVARVRSALGDETSESQQMFAMKSISAASLDVVADYAAAVEAQSRGRYEEAERVFRRAIARDPTFGPGYLGLAGMARNLGRPDEAEKFTDQALSYVAGMTERERFNTRAFYYRITGDYQQCVKEYGELVARYAADPLAHNQRAICLSKLRDMPGAIDEMRQVVQLVPKRALFRGNLALYMAYKGDFPQAEKEALSIEESYDLATLVVAFARLGEGRLPDADAAFDQLAAVTNRGRSWSASGLGHLALYEGRFSDAVRILEEGAAADLAATPPNSDKAARKHVSAAYAQLARGRAAAAIASAETAQRLSHTVEVRFLAARVFVEAGALQTAREIAADLAKGLPAEPRAYAKTVEGLIALKNGDASRAVALLNEANGILDTWLGHFDLGRAYLELGAYPQADSEFDRCIQRRGEALSVFLDEEPTVGYLPPLYYYQGIVREGLKSAGAVDSFKQYLTIRAGSKEDPLREQVRQRIE
jgi:tetratricopeptide (TPR) repeat protein/tRNA A-37 threonylcarbamoyl transferase component Bud32